MSLQTAKRTFIFCLLVTLFLAACGGADQGSPTATPASTDSSESEPADGDSVEEEATATRETAAADSPEVSGVEPTETAGATEAAEASDPAASEPTEATSAEAPTAGLPAPTLFETAWEDRSIFAAGLVALDQPVLSQLPGASVYHLDMAIGDSLQEVQGQQEVLYTNQETVALEEIYFHLFPNLLGGRSTLSNIQVNGVDITAAADYEPGGTAVRLPLPQALQPGEAVVIHLDFVVDVPNTPGSNYGVFAFVDNALALAHFYPQVAVYDDEGWNAEPPPGNADPTYGESSFYLVRIAAPAEVILATSGVNIERETSGEQQTATFAAGPVRDFFVAASPEFELESEVVGETTINSYTLSQFADSGDEALGYAVASIETLSERLGRYPFTEFDVVSTNNLALGVEYPGIIVLTLRLYDPAADFGGPSNLVVMESVMAHEAGHQWFYSLVGNDQLDEPWLDESLTQYVTYLYFVDQAGEANAQGFFETFYGRWDRVEQEEIPIGMGAGAYEGNEYSAIVYGRGPIFFDALAEAMGQESFDAFLRDYVARYKWGIATGEGFKQLAEEHCGCDLTALFNEWVYP
jgi:hypothetical protein